MTSGYREPLALPETSEDLFLGGALKVRQPVAGYRAGTDAVLLAACLSDPDVGVGPVLDAGAGVGVVGLCIAARCPRASVVLIEREAHLVALARDNVERNGLASRALVVEADVMRPTGALRNAAVQSETFPIVVANPPYHDGRRTTAAVSRLKAAAHQMSDDALDAWARFLCRMAAPWGRVVMIHKVDALPRIISAFDGRFGSLSVLPIHPRAGEEAIRVLVTGIKGSKAPLSIRPGLLLHGKGQAFTPEVEAIFRNGAPLPGLGG
jgi:FkbM family methyltransferase